MADDFVLKSVHDSTELRFTGEVPHDLEGYDGTTFHVGLIGPVGASVDVYDIHVEHWAAFFQDLAANWRGWVGTKTADSLEGHLRLAATSDHAGHIAFRVRLRGMLAQDDWLAEVNIHLEAGQLDRIAIAAARYFGKQRSDLTGGKP